MKNKLICLSLLAMLHLVAFTQEQESNSGSSNWHRVGISGKANTFLSIGAGFDAFVSPHLQLDISASPFLAMGIEGGLNYHLFDNSEVKWSPYAGLHVGYYKLDFLVRTDYYPLYFPIGIFYTDERRLFFSIDAGYAYQREDDYHQGDYNPYRIVYKHTGMLRIGIGYRF